MVGTGVGTNEAYGLGVSKPAAHAQSSAGITITWHDSTRNADEALREHVAQVLGVSAETVSTGRLCVECGSSNHGRPWATGGVEVSLSRSGPHLLTAVSTAGPIGADVESIDAPDDWARKEAILKLIGRGLAVPMSEIRVVEYDVRDLEAPDGYRAALATYPSENP